MGSHGFPGEDFFAGPADSAVLLSRPSQLHGRTLLLSWLPRTVATCAIRTGHGAAVPIRAAALPAPAGITSVSGTACPGRRSSAAMSALPEPTASPGHGSALTTPLPSAKP